MRLDLPALRSLSYGGRYWPGERGPQASCTMDLAASWLHPPPCREIPGGVPV